MVAIKLGPPVKLTFSLDDGEVRIVFGLAETSSIAPALRRAILDASAIGNRFWHWTVGARSIVIGLPGSEYAGYAMVVFQVKKATSLMPMTIRKGYVYAVDHPDFNFTTPLPEGGTIVYRFHEGSVRRI